MSKALDTYLGWEQPQHFGTCSRPSWQVDFRTEDGELRRRYGGDSHTCPNDSCDHGDTYPRITVRIVCPSCQAALVVAGEDGLTRQGLAAATTDGYGVPPRRIAGLLLWPGRPWLDFGRLSTDEPHDFVVTRPGVQRVTEVDVVGQITQGRGKRGAVVWAATAVPSADGPYGYDRIRWARATGDTKPPRTVAGAAKWVAAQLADQQSGGAE
ncbi:hypothetical protein AB0R01_14685 [Streptomyces rochei]|uniref:hypothetical protein n=1 Tax=Streptomyces rochei TaxID=1928 RepID=UPI0034439087